MHPVMRLYEDCISGSTAAVSLPALARMIFVVHGGVAIDGTALSDGEAWSGPGGCAFLHKHWGPGIRCLLDGGIRIDTHGRSTSYGPGTPWYETGSDPVFAQAALDRPSRFIRVMVLPRSLLGKSSFQFVNEEDKAKPRVQQYKIFTDLPIATPKA